MVLAAEIGAAAGAGAQRRIADRVGSVVGIEAADDAVLDVGDEKAATAAVVGRTTDADAAFSRSTGRRAGSRGGSIHGST